MASVPAAKAHTESEPFMTDLIAGKYIDVGDVFVWNDGNCLYVKYVTNDGWYISEVHLEVATELSGIPQAKGNPIPGKIHIREQGLLTQEYQFDPIPLKSWTPGTELYIAAHAKVITESMRKTISAVTDYDFSGFDDTSKFSNTDAMANLGTTSLSLLSGFGKLTGYYGSTPATLTHRGTRGLGVIYGETDEVDHENINNPERIDIVFDIPVYRDIPG